MSGPHFCRHDGSQLFKVEVWNVKSGCRMGHNWICPQCDERSIGYGDPDEYDGTPKPKPKDTP